MVTTIANLIWDAWAILFRAMFHQYTLMIAGVALGSTILIVGGANETAL